MVPGNEVKLEQVFQVYEETCIPLSKERDHPLGVVLLKMLAFNASEDTVARNSGSWTPLDPYAYISALVPSLYGQLRRHTVEVASATARWEG